MDFTKREYQMIKTKNSLVTNKICFFFQNSTERSANWLTTEQTVNVRNFKYYKLNTLAARKVFIKSRHECKTPLIVSTSAIVKQQNPLLRYRRFTDERLAGAFVLTAIKVNNNIATTEEFKNLNIFYYQIAMMTLYNYMLTSIKLTCHMTIVSK
jgi:hypothetical protein